MKYKVSVNELVSYEKTDFNDEHEMDYNVSYMFNSEEAMLRFIKEELDAPDNLISSEDDFRRFFKSDNYSRDNLDSIIRAYNKSYEIYRDFMEDFKANKDNKSVFVIDRLKNDEDPFYSGITYNPQPDSYKDDFHVHYSTITVTIYQ